MRILAFILDYVLVGVIIYFTLEPFYPSYERFISDNFFINHVSDITFISYLFLSIVFFRRTFGMFICKLKVETECCIIKVALLRILLIPFYLLNILWIPFRKKYLQDEISGSIIK